MNPKTQKISQRKPSHGTINIDYTAKSEPTPERLPSALCSCNLSDTWAGEKKKTEPKTNPKPKMAQTTGTQTSALLVPLSLLLQFIIFLRFWFRNLITALPVDCCF